jgi:hypothetical protein
MTDMKEMSSGDLFVFFAFDFIGVLRCCALWPWSGSMAWQRVFMGV